MVDTEVLRAIYRLSLRQDVDAALLPYLSSELFLRIECWPRIGVIKAMKSLEQHELITVRSSTLFFPAGVFLYQTLDSASWMIRRTQNCVFAAPEETWEALQVAKACRWNASVYGVQVSTHHSYLALTNKGIDVVDIRAEDFLTKG